MSAMDVVAFLFTVLALTGVAWMGWQLRSERKDVEQSWTDLVTFAEGVGRRESEVRRREYRLTHEGWRSR